MFIDVGSHKMFLDIQSWKRCIYNVRQKKDYIYVKLNSLSHQFRNIRNLAQHLEENINSVQIDLMDYDYELKDIQRYVNKQNKKAENYICIALVSIISLIMPLGH